MSIFPLNLLTRRHRVVRSIDDASRLGVPVLGSISEFDPRPGARLPGDDYPEALEAYYRLTDAVRLPDFHLRGRAIVVTGAASAVGKSTTAKNLATLLARDGSKVILVDADVNRVARRKPGDGTSSSGFAGLLVNQLMLPPNALLHTMDPRLKLLPAGSITASAEGLMLSPRLPHVVNALRDLADYVIFDVATVRRDLHHLTRQADVTLIVVRAGSTKRKEASHAVAALRDANSGLTGIVLNRAPVVITAPKPEQAPAVAQSTDVMEAPERRLEIAVDELLADLEAALSLIRDLRHVDAKEDAHTEREEETELVTMDR